MLLSARVLTSVGSVNTFAYATQQQWTAGDTVSVYLQLIDASVNGALAGYQPQGLRYMPVAGATLKVTIPNLDDNKVVARYATQPFSQDPSIWVLSILATDVVSGCPDLVLSLSEPVGGGGFKLTSGRVQSILCIQPGTTNAVPPITPQSYVGE